MAGDVPALFVVLQGKRQKMDLGYVTSGEIMDSLLVLTFFFSVDFKPHASMDTVHHMLLFGCNEPSSTESYW